MISLTGRELAERPAHEANAIQLVLMIVASQNRSSPRIVCAAQVLAPNIVANPMLPVTLLICADEFCIGQHVAIHGSLDLRFRRAS